MGLPEGYDHDDDDVVMAQREVLQDFRDDTDEEDSEGLVLTKGGGDMPGLGKGTASSEEGLAPTGGSAHNKGLMVDREFGCHWKPTDIADIRLSPAQDIMDEVLVKHSQVRRYDPAWIDTDIGEED